MNANTDWTSAIAIVVAGIIVGVLVLVLNRRRGVTAAQSQNLELHDLHAKRDALVLQLRDLDENASVEERQRIEREAADVLRRIDGHQAAPQDATGAPRAAAAMNPVVKGYLWGAASVAALAALGYFVMQAATPRQEGGLATGGIEAGSMQQRNSQQAAPPDPAVQRLEAAVQSDPNNLQLRNQLAQAYLERENLIGVFEQTQFVLTKSPDDSRALTFQALVRLAMGETDTAVQMLQRATKSDPANLDGWVSLAWVYAQTDKLPEAEKMIAEAKRQSPADAAQLDGVFTQMKQHAAQPQSTASAGALPPDHPPVGPGAVAPTPLPASSSGAADARAVTVTVDLDRAARQKNGVLFVMARGAAGGPPVAVKRLQVASFPVTFQFGAADSMMGQPLPDTFRLEARLDQDGDPLTKTPADPAAAQPNVAIGERVALALK